MSRCWNRWRGIMTTNHFEFVVILLENNDSGLFELKPFFPELVLPNSLFNYTMLRWNTVKYSDITTQKDANTTGKDLLKSSHNPQTTWDSPPLKMVAGNGSIMSVLNSAQTNSVTVSTVVIHITMNFNIMKRLKPE